MLITNRIAPGASRNLRLHTDRRDRIHDHRLMVLEMFSKSPLSIEQISEKTGLSPHYIDHLIIPALEDSGCIELNRTKYHITEIGKGIAEGKTKSTPEDRIKVLGLLKKKASSIWALKGSFPSSFPYHGFTVLYSTLDDLRDEGQVKRESELWKLTQKGIDSLEEEMMPSGGAEDKTTDDELLKVPIVQAILKSQSPNGEVKKTPLPEKKAIIIPDTVKQLKLNEDHVHILAALHHVYPRPGGKFDLTVSLYTTAYGLREEYIEMTIHYRKVREMIIALNRKKLVSKSTNNLRCDVYTLTPKGKQTIELIMKANNGAINPQKYWEWK